MRHVDCCILFDPQRFAWVKQTVVAFLWRRGAGWRLLLKWPLSCCGCAGSGLPDTGPLQGREASGRIQWFEGPGDTVRVRGRSSTGAPWWTLVCKVFPNLEHFRASLGQVMSSRRPSLMNNERTTLFSLQPCCWTNTNGFHDMPRCRTFFGVGVLSLSRFLFAVSWKLTCGIATIFVACFWQRWLSYASSLWVCKINGHFCTSRLAVVQSFIASYRSWWTPLKLLDKTSQVQNCVVAVTCGHACLTSMM